MPISSSKIAAGLSTLGLIVLSFLGGTAVVEFETFPYVPHLQRAYLAASAHGEQWRQRGHFEEKGLPDFYSWTPTKSNIRGVERSTPSEMYDGFTLVHPGHTQAGFLLDAEGEVVHEWHAKFSDIWPDRSDDCQTNKAAWRASRLFSNGDLLVQFTCSGRTPYGAGLVKLNVDSEVLWAYGEHTHHDMSVDDGSIYTLAHRIRNTVRHPYETDVEMPDFVLEDELVHLSADGEELERFSILEALLKGGYGSIFSGDRSRWVENVSGIDRELTSKDRARSQWDILHTNTVNPVSDSFARRHGLGNSNHLWMTSFRALDAIAVLDVEQREVVWLRQGYWRAQHDPDILPNDRVILFDNLGGQRGSRLLEVAPDTMKTTWQYQGTPENPFFTPIAGRQQALPNGNVLATSAQSGRVFEVNREGELVWNWFTPRTREIVYRKEGDKKRKTLRAVVSAATRHAPDSLDFDFQGPSATEARLSNPPE